MKSTLLNIVNTCKILDSASNSSILSHIASLTARLGYKTTFLDHDTIFSLDSSQNSNGMFLVINIQNGYDLLISFLLSKSELISYTSGFLISKSKDFSKYLDLLSKIEIKNFLINNQIPKNSVLTGNLGMISCCLTVFGKFNLEKFTKKIAEFSKNIQAYNFLEMDPSNFNLQKINQDEDSTHITFEITFNLIESPSIVMNKYKKFFENIIDCQLNLNWKVKYHPWYDFRITFPNFIKKSCLSIDNTNITSFCDSKFSPLYELRKNKDFICFNYSPDLDRFSRLANEAKICYNLMRCIG